MSADLHPIAAKRHLILMGAGASNLQIASTLFRQKISGLEISCIANEEQVIHPSMLPELVADKYTLPDCTIPVQQVLERLHVQWIPSKVKGISASSNSVQLENHQTLSFDWLSINSTPLQHRDLIEQLIPGAKRNGFFVYPMELFSKHWGQVCTKRKDKALRIAIIGNSLRSMEIALAVRQRLPSSAVTLIMHAVLNSNIDAATQPARMRLLQALKDQRVTVLQDTVLACETDYLQLGCGAQLVSNISIIALEPQKPAWLTEQHSHIFFQPIESTHYNEKICSLISGIQKKKGLRSDRPLQTYYGGASFAIAQWRDHTLQGRVAGWVKYWQDRQLLKL